MLNFCRIANPQAQGTTPLNYTLFPNCAKPSVHACFEGSFRNTGMAVRLPRGCRDSDPALLAENPRHIRPKRPPLDIVWGVICKIEMIDQSCLFVD